jgi:hypothetical protein
MLNIPSASTTFTLEAGEIEDQTTGSGSQSAQTVAAAADFHREVMLTRKSELPTLAACHLPGGDIEAVEEVGGADHEDQGRESLLVVVPGGLLPDLVWDRVGLVSKPGNGKGSREGGTFGVGEVGCLPPGGHGEEALVCFACPLGAACARINAQATAIKLARAQVD